MKESGIILKRRPYEEPHNLNLILMSSAGDFAGSIEYYCRTNELQALGNSLKRFPRAVPDKHSCRWGSPDKENNFAFFLELVAFTTGSTGHAALSVTMSNNHLDPDAASCHFCIQTDVSAINKLGDLIVRFGELQHSELRWQASGEGSLS